MMNDNIEKIFKLIRSEEDRQAHDYNLIASENYVSDDIRNALASGLTNKYAEGYPGLKRYSGNIGRYYGGCQYIDQIEELCCDLWRQVFNTTYHVNVQPHSGTHANTTVYQALLRPGDTILAMAMDEGAHLTHGSSASIVGRTYNIVNYHLNGLGLIDYKDIYNKVIEFKPKLVILGSSAYSRTIDFKKISNVIYEAASTISDGSIGYRPYIMADISHIAGLVATGEHPSPFGIADVITSTTHKTLRGPRGALIFCDRVLANKIDSALFPGNSGGPIMNTIAAKAVCAAEALTPEYKEYIHQVVLNAKAMAKEFRRLGYKIVSGGTSNHMFTIDLRPLDLTGLEVQTALENYGISVNKELVPGDKETPKNTSGIRIGTPAITTNDWEEEDVIDLVGKIDKIIKKLQNDRFTKKK